MNISVCRGRVGFYIVKIKIRTGRHGANHVSASSTSLTFTSSVSMHLGAKYGGLRFLLHSYNPSFPLGGYDASLKTNIRDLKSQIQEKYEKSCATDICISCPLCLNSGEWTGGILSFNS